MLEERDEVRKGFVKGAHVGVVRLEVAPMQAVEQGVRRLVRDDVVREAGEDDAAGEVLALVVRQRRKVAEEQRDFLRRVVGIRLAQGVGINPQPPHEALFFPQRRVFLAPPRLALRPEDRPPERALEVTDRGHRHGIDHLLMKPRIALGRRQPVLREHLRIVEVYRRVKARARRIDIDHLHELADRPRRQVFPRHAEGHLIHHRRLELRGKARIESVTAQTAKGRGSGQGAFLEKHGR